MKDRRKYNKMIRNSFCPTGPGGGVDPTCSPSTSVDTAVKILKDSHLGKIDQAASNFTNRQIQSILKSAKEFGTEIPNEKLEEYKDKFNKEFHQNLKNGMSFKLELPKGRWITTQLTRQMRNIDTTTYAVRIDFGVEGRSDTSVGEHLEKESLQMLKEVKRLASYFKSKQLPVEVQGSDSRRKEVYDKWMDKLGFTSKETRGKAILYNKKLTSNASKRTSPTKFDPTRTTTLRRAFIGKLRRKFARLRKVIYDLLVVEDALGLKKNLTYNHIEKLPSGKYRLLSHTGKNLGTFDSHEEAAKHEGEVEYFKHAANSFCPTGPGGGVDPTCSPGGSMSSSFDLPKEVKDNIDKHGMNGPFNVKEGGGWEKTLKSMGHSETTIAEVRQLFDFHRHGGPSQEKADLEIVRHLSEGTEIGKALRDQIRMEEGLREYWESTGRHVQKEKEKQQERSDLEYKWKNGMGNTDAYSSIEDQWEVEHAYKFKPLGDKLYYRKGGLDKDVVSTSENSSGAKSHSVSGSTSVQPHFKPTNKFTAKEMHAAGYRVLGGFGFNQMGYSGEAEVTWVKIPKLSTNERWRFNTTPEQLEAFKEWLKTQVEYYVTGMTDEELWNKFIESGFKKGAGRAFDDTKPQAGWTEAEGAFYAGTKDQFLKSAFGQPESLSKIQLLAARTFDELEGMSADMQNKLGRILVDGLTRGNGPIAIAREMSNQLNLSMTRAETIARTELIRAHAEGQLVGLEELGVDEVGVMVEWSTAGDDRVCELCEPMEGVVLKIEEARGMIPRHCNCRCAFIPANVAEPTDDQKRGKRKIMSAVRTSAALGKDDFSTAVPVTKERPKSVLPVIANVFDPDEPRDDSGKWTTGESLVGDKGELIKTDGGRIDVQHVTKFSPRKQSVIDFVVDEDKRGKGIGDKLLKQALSKYNDLGGQVSSIASLKVFHNNGFRNPDLPNGSFNEHLKLFKEEGGSLYMAHKDDNGKAYITTNLYVTTIPAPTVVYQFSQLLAGARK